MTVSKVKQSSQKPSDIFLGGGWGGSLTLFQELYSTGEKTSIFYWESDKNLSKIFSGQSAFQYCQNVTDF